MIAQLNYRPSPQPAHQPLSSYQFKPQRAPFPKWYGTPPTTPLFLSQIATYKDEAFYTRVHDWTRTTPTSRQLKIAISSDILDSLPSSISFMFLNDERSASDRIAMLSLLLTRLNPSSKKKLLLEISDLTRLNMRLSESSINYTLRVRGISQRMQGVTIDRIIPLFAIASLEHDQYPVVRSRYLVGDTALVNCDLLQLSGLLSSEETRQRDLGILNAPPSNTIANSFSNTPTNPNENGLPALKPHQPPAQSSAVTYPTTRGVP